MAKRKDSDLKVAQRQQQVAELHLKSWSQAAIAQHLGVAQSTVSADLKALAKYWRESAVRDFDLCREIEVQKLNRIESESWAAWERSQKPAQSADIVGTATATAPTRKRIKNQYGDPRFLGILNQCMVSRRALLALDAAPRGPESDPDAGITLEVRRARVLAIFTAICQREGVELPPEASALIESRTVRPSHE